MILTKDPKSVTMVEEIFGPVVTVRAFSDPFVLVLALMVLRIKVYVFEDSEYKTTCELIDATTSYALTGSM